MTKEEIYAAVRQQYDSMEANDKIRDKGLRVPKDTECLYDICYCKKFKDICRLDIYRPKSIGGRKIPRTKKLPVIVSIHGGGWIYGDKKLYSFYCMQLARRGFAVVNFTYRLAPDYQFPAALVDTNEVFKFILKNAGEYAFDAGNIFATGDSAGGNYLATYAEIAGDKNFAKEFPFKVPERLKLKAVCLNCGMYDFDAFKTSGGKDFEALIHALMPQGGNARELDLASPARHVTKNFPPAYLITASLDFLRPMAGIMANSFIKADIEFRYKCWSNPEEKLYHVFMLNLRNKFSAPCIDEQCDFFKAYIE